MVTDAISAARAGPGKYTLAGWDLEIGEDMIARSPDGSHFVGSTATMPLVADVLQEMGIEDEEIADLCCKRPREVIGYS
jgi:N-acetylglucosamine-6-phosphate deacetylase